MGKATRWIRKLFGMKKDKESVTDNSNSSERKEKNRWSFAKDSGGLREIPAVDTAWLRSLIAESDNKQQNKHAIAVAAATAAAADAAVAAAQAAVAVVRLTSRGRGALLSGGRERLAAVKIQTVFRGFLARKARRALRGLVKLQAVVRGYLVRKRAAATLHSMEALIRAQAIVHSRQTGPCNKLQPEMRFRKSIERFEESSQFHSKRFPASSDPSPNAFDESPKIVEIDTCRPESRSRRMSSGDHYYQVISSPLPCPVPRKYVLDHHHHDHLQDFDWGFVPIECKSVTAQNTPRFGSSGRANIVPEECKPVTAHNTPRSGCPGRADGPVTPAKSMCGDHSFLRAYSNGPSYMANTQSSQAKLRSQSAPRQRPEPNMKRRMSLSEVVASRSSFSGVRMHVSCNKVEEDHEYV